MDAVKKGKIKDESHETKAKKFIEELADLAGSCGKKCELNARN